MNRNTNISINSFLGLSEKIIFSLTLIISIFIISCSPKTKKETIVEDNISNLITLYGKTIQIPVKILQPRAMAISGQKLIILDDHKDSLFKIFNLQDLSYMYSWGRMGRGPNEFIKINDQYFNAYKNILEVLDYNSIKRLYVFDNHIQIFNTINLPQVKSPINRLQKLSDSIYIADNSIEEESEHMLINIFKNEIIDKFGIYPKNKISNPVDRYQIYSKSVTSNPNGDKFAAFYLFFPKIKIYLKNRQQNEVVIKFEGIKKYSSDNEDQKVLHFVLPFSTAKYIYVFRINKTDAEVNQDISNYRPELLILDWNGDLLKRYKLNAPITRFTVSEKYKKLYGTSVLNENEIYVYDLPFLNE